MSEEIPEKGFTHHTYVADAGQSVLRVDKFLSDLMPNASRSKIQDIAKVGGIWVNGSAQKSNYKVKPGDVVEVKMPYPVREITLEPEDIPLHVVYEDEELVVIDKQAGLVVHPGYGNFSGTLVNALLFHFDHLAPKEEEPDRPGLVHRLDKDTTGLMVIAKTEKALTHLSKQFFERTNERRYWALVWGDFKTNEGVIEGNIGRSVKDRKVMQVFPEGNAGKTAVTRFKVLERLGYVTLVECKLETGRTHQIRAHFKYLGNPVFGDPIYGGNKILKGTRFSKYRQFVENNFSILNRQALHAKKLSFEHPVTGKWLEFESDLPTDMNEVVERWRNYISHRKDV
jgi:23S rRNA pseudouridine1911/1915/1917 synthase